MVTPGFTLDLMSPDPDLEVGLHTHEAAHLIVHLHGTYLSTAAHAPSRARGPLIVCNPPGTTHRDRYERTGGHLEGRFLNVGIPLDTWQASLAPSTGGDATCLTTLAAHQLVVRLLQEWFSPGQDAEVVLDSLCTELLAQRHPVERHSRQAPAWLSRARDMLRDESAAVTVRRVAEVCGVHPVAMARTFRRWEGCTPAEFARMHRLQRATEHLARGRAPAMVAAQTGYADQSHLTNAMQRELGITPAAYRALFAAARS